MCDLRVAAPVVTHPSPMRSIGVSGEIAALKGVANYFSGVRMLRIRWEWGDYGGIAPVIPPLPGTARSAVPQKNCCLSRAVNRIVK
ncbi:MAG: hypothetical protein CVV49_04735 [Spirochaetae bacterium HGW-Spirochaetae-5]|nr:MAG: hypothetical protein CVV49_04735 [Spirochaetae bacterium HGW-Spirochaetae-5]